MAFLFHLPLAEFPDRAHRQLLIHPANLRELVEQAAPEAAKGLQFERAHLLNRDLPLPDWRRRENNLLFQVPFRSPQAGGVDEVLVGVLVEHQTKPEPPMPLRSLIYATAYWDQQWLAWEKLPEKGRPPLRLTPVLPIVFHAGPRRWRTHRTLADLFVPPEELRALVPVWEPVFWHLFEQPPDTLRQAARPWLQLMAVVRTDQMKAATFQAVCAETAQRLEPLAAQDKMRWHELMSFLVGWEHYRRPKKETAVLDTITQASITNVALREEIKSMSKKAKQTWVEWAVSEAEAQVRREFKDKEGEFMARWENEAKAKYESEVKAKYENEAKAKYESEPRPSTKKGQDVLVVRTCCSCSRTASARCRRRSCNASLPVRIWTC